MDINQIKKSEVKNEVGIHVYKDKEAPIKVITFINLRCPYCRRWHEKSKKTLKEFIESGKVELIIKPFDKEKEELKSGNVAHRFLNYDTPFETWNNMDSILSSQNRWGILTKNEVVAYMKNELNLTEQDNQEAAEKIVEEAKRAHITSVPTVIVGEHIFDEHISEEKLRELLQNE